MKYLAGVKAVKQKAASSNPKSSVVSWIVNDRCLAVVHQSEVLDFPPTVVSEQGYPDPAQNQPVQWRMTQLCLKEHKYRLGLLPVFRRTWIFGGKAYTFFMTSSPDWCACHPGELGAGFPWRCWGNPSACWKSPNKGSNQQTNKLSNCLSTYLHLPT